jgi:hypothetical protein
LIASENNVRKRENKMLKMELSQLKTKGHVQPSQDNRDHMVKKLEKRSTVTWAKLSQINLKYLIKRLIRPRSRKNLMSSALSTQHCDTSYSNVPTTKVIKQNSLEDKEAYLKEDVLLVRKKTII